MSAIDVIKKEFRGTKFKITSTNSKKIKFLIPGGIDFEKTKSEIFTAIITIKPKLETELSVTVEQLNSDEMIIK